MDKFLSVGDVARILGISRMSIYRYIDEGRLRAVKTKGEGGRVKVPYSALKEFLEVNTTTDIILKLKRNRNELVRILKECRYADCEVLRKRLEVVCEILKAGDR